MKSEMQRELNELKTKLNIAQYNQERRDVLLENIAYENKCLEVLEKSLRKYETLLVKCNNGLVAYKEERLKVLEYQIEDNLEVIYPGDDFHVKFDPQPFGGRDNIEMNVGRGTHLAPTNMQNGRLFRQVVSFSATTRIQLLEGCELLIMDEAINSGDPNSTAMVSDLINDLINRGYQIILIEHKEELYSSLPRRQYNLKRDVRTNKITEVIVNDYQ